MLRSISKAALAAALLSSPAMALALPSWLATPTSHEGMLKAGADCTDFNGNWKGSCTLNGKTITEDTVRVRQVGCYIISKGGETLPLGGMTTTATTLPKSEGFPGSTSSVTYAADWNEDKTAVNTRMSLSVRSTGDQQFFVDVKGTGSLAIVDGRLVESFKSSDGKINVECSYDKQ